MFPGDALYDRPPPPQPHWPCIAGWFVPTKETAPKRPMSPFFQLDLISSIKDSLGADAKRTDVLRAAGKQWKLLDEDARKPFEEAYEADKIRYAEEVKSYFLHIHRGLRDEGSLKQAAWCHRFFCTGEFRVCQDEHCHPTPLVVDNPSHYAYMRRRKLDSGLWQQDMAEDGVPRKYYPSPP